MTWAEIGRTTLPQARLLLNETPHVDGHIQSSHAVCETLIAIAEAAGMVKRSTGAKPSPPTKAAETPPAKVYVPELQAAIEARAKVLAAEIARTMQHSE
jgi:hypothetical protein